MKIRNNFVKNGTLTIIILPGDTDERIACWTSSQLNVWRQTSILYWVKKFMFHSFITRSVKICYGFWHFKSLFGNFLYGLQREQLQWPKSFQWISIHVTSGQDSFSRILNVDWSFKFQIHPPNAKAATGEILSRHKRIFIRIVQNQKNAYYQKRNLSKCK